jgi:antitoxin component of RelBE/YafQ-DinJ toxin-antitoxin module
MQPLNRKKFLFADTKSLLNLKHCHHILTHNGIPLEVKIPNKTTLKAMEDLEKGKNVKKFDTA